VNEKALAVGFMLVFLMVGLSGCQSPEIYDYQIFYSNDLNIEYFTLLQDSPLNISNSTIDNIIQDGKSLSFRIDYPHNWTVKFYLGGLGLFPLIFFPINTSFLQNFTSFYLTFDYLSSSEEYNNLNQLKNDLTKAFADYKKTEYTLDKNTKAWIAIGNINVSGEYKKYNNFTQGLALISYKNNELYIIQSYFSNNNPANIEIFNHMIKSFKKI